MNIDLRSMATFGVAGNFTGHLEQAGEARDFTQVKTIEAKAPKAVFPTFIPNAKAPVPEFLGIFPFDEYRIIFPKGESKLQIEPECAIVCDVVYDGDNVSKLTPIVFSASNDCSIRKEGAKKISQKKNWGESSKGFAGNFIKIDKFEKGGILDKYRIASFLIRDGEIYTYGEDSAVSDYSYIYQQLLNWLVDKFNHQQNEGPAEDLHSYLLAAGKPERVMVSIGATRYTEFGEHNFLKNGDKALVVLYPQDAYTFEEIKHRALRDNLEEDNISVLIQDVVL